MDTHPVQEFRQLGDIAGNPSRLILAEQLGCRAAARLILEIDIRQLLPGAVRHDEGRTNVLDSPGRREAAS